ncbi:hypothetical protein I5M27_04565 [Adhaeribacter sp. BT258]|uniref:PE-PGRS family protein n=1 Tax=Adhaeribacter terrigena TaxID=2793070 RepID=A0ABS1BYL0_9BACT|nr:hypothetical protein [Adhaeribacter terrigena]MBK0402244.1 hypothetical protein [Adhaeribacter terrigena]
MKRLFKIPFYFLILLFTACNKNDDAVPAENAPPFSSDPQSTALTPMIEETSGIADSKTAPGYLWAHEDSGNPTELHLIRHDGSVTKKVYLKGIKNRDWEDLALSGNQLFLADIGDNNKKQTSYTIYQFPEPSPGTDTVSTFKQIRFRYPDGSHDAEALLIDPITNAILIITKQDDPSRIYKITPPFNYTAIDTAELVGTISFTGVVSAALSPSGTEAILKTYSGLYYYKQKNGESLAEFLQQPPVTVPYKIEPQGEAVAFANNNSGFFTLSEKGFTNAAVKLYFYPRK